MKNIVIINQPLSNRGDEAAHRSLIRSLNQEYKDAQISVVFIESDVESVEQMRIKSPQNTYINIPAKIKGARWFIPKMLTKHGLLGFAKFFPFYNKYIKIIKKADVIINAPGGICMGGFQNWVHIFYLSLALNHNRNVYYYSRSIGTFPEKTKENRIFKKRSIAILQRLKFISLRDNKSMQIAEQLGIDYVNSIDTAFLDIPVVASDSFELPNELKGDYVIFVPNSLTWHPHFKNIKQNKIDKLYLDVFDYLFSKFPEYKIVLLPQLFNDPITADFQYFSKLKKLVKSNSVICLPETIGSDIQQKIIKQSKLVIGARYHSIVFAINNQVPVVSLSYEHKMNGLLELLDISDCNVDFHFIVLSDNVENNLLINKIETVLSYNHDRELLAAKAQNLAKECFNKMVKQLREC
jgi:colanic acid/amylovoran biosynthesis protein